MFVLSFKNGNNNPMTDCFNKSYMPLVEIKDFNALIDNKPFLVNESKTNKKRIEKPIEISRNDD